MVPVKPIGARAKRRLAEMRKDPETRLALAVKDYLELKGWNILLSFNPTVESVVPVDDAGLGTFRFSIGLRGWPPEPKVTP
jgi:hypothetical protein